MALIFSYWIFLSSVGWDFVTKYFNYRSSNEPGFNLMHNFSGKINPLGYVSTAGVWTTGFVQLAV